MISLLLPKPHINTRADNAMNIDTYFIALYFHASS